MQPSDVRRRAGELIDLIQRRFVRRDGLLARCYPPSDKTLFDNFDDIVPFFLYFGQADFLLDQARIIRRNGDNLQSLCGHNGLLVTRAMDEWFGGLHALWKATGDAQTRALLGESVDFVMDRILEGAFLPAAVRLADGRRAQYYEPWSSGLLESFCEMRDEFPRAFAAAQTVMREWLGGEYCQRYGLFPYRVHRSPLKNWADRVLLGGHVNRERNSRPYLPALVCAEASPRQRLKETLRRAGETMRFWQIHGWYSQMMKANSTCAFTLLEFYRATNDGFWLEGLERWIEGAIQRHTQGGRVYQEHYPAAGKSVYAETSSALILCDVLCDAAWFAPGIPKRLDKAREILDALWDSRLPCGLAPFHEGAGYAHIDHQVDVAIALRRLGELSGEAAYRRKSEELMQACLEQMWTPEGYQTYFGLDQPPVIDPKYNALLLKGMIHLLTLDQPIYPDLHSLFKDR